MFAYKIFCGILGNVAPAVKPTSLPPDEKKSIMEREPTEKELFKVAEAVGRSWQTIGVYLGFTSQELEDYKTAHRDSTRDRLFSILCAWKNRGEEKPTGARLLEACTEARVGGAVKKAFGIY
jgi:hypothetical protein